MNYFLNKKVFLICNVNYAGTNKVTFKNIRSILTTSHGTFGTFDYTIQQSMQRGSEKQSLGSISLGLGVGVIL
jgi:hypothetical protein